MEKVMRVFAVLLAAAPFLAVCIGRAAVILEHPQTQYVLVGNTVTFHCKTLGGDAFWLINDSTISETHLDNKEEYESLGFSFSDSTHGMWGHHNLTMNVSASENLNNTKIECKALDDGHSLIGSDTAHLYVFTDLSPYPPRLTSAVVRCWDLSLPQLYGTVQVQPRWTRYDITEFRINIINSSSGEVLKQTTIPYEGQNTHHYFNETLPGCVVSLNGNSSVLVSSTAFSSVHGESAPSSAIEARLDSGLSNFSGQVINQTIFFYPNGTPFLHLEIKLPWTICFCLKVAYTIEIEDNNSGQIETEGPFYHTGPTPLATRNVISDILVRDNNYTMAVTVKSSGEIATSKTSLFNTILRLTPDSCKSNAGDNTFLFQLGMSASLFIAVVITSTLVIFLLSVYIYHKREHIFITLAIRRAHSGNYPAGVDPDRPVYESIQPLSYDANADTERADGGATRDHHATSGHAQCNHPPTGKPNNHGNDKCYESDVIVVFDSGRKDIFNGQASVKNYSQ